jgi:O-antigen/teichoic acid export membrane protein
MQDKNISKAIFLNTLYNYIGSIFIAIFSFVTLLYLTKNLSVGEFGEYNLILSTQVFFVLLSSFGLPSIVLRFIPEYIVRNDYSAARKIIRYSIAIAVLSGIVLSIISLLLSKAFPEIINKFFIAEYLFLSSVLGFLRVEVRICDSIFCAFLKQGYKTFLEVLGAGIKLLLFILSIKFGFGLFGIILCIGIVDMLLIIAYLFRIEYYLYGKKSTTTDLSKSRVITYGIKEYTAKVLSFFLDTRIDAYFITFYLGVASTGIFYFVLNIVTMLAEYMPGNIMQPVSQAIFARQYAKYENQKEINYLFKLNNKLKAFFVFPVFIGFFLVSDKVVILFFNKYENSIQLFPIILFFMLFYIFLIPIRNIITTLEKSEITVLSSIVILYKIPMTILLTKNFGLMGTAFAMGSTLFIYFLIHFFLTKRLINLEYPWHAFYKILTNSLIAGVAILFLRPFIADIFSLCGVIFLSGIIYLIVSYINKTFEEYDRQIINKPFKRLMWNF